MSNLFRRKRRPTQGSVINKGQNSGVQIGTNAGSVTVHQTMPRGGRSDAALLHDYLCRLHAACNTLVFGDLPGGKAGQQMQMAEVFTMLRVQPVADVRWPGTNLISRGREVVDELPTVIAALAQQRACVLLGEPGGGKSTVVAFLTLALAEAQPGFPGASAGTGLARLGEGWTAGALLPVRARLKEVTGNLWEGVPETQHADLSDDERAALIALLEQRLRDGALLLLDGLDEVPTERLETIQQVIADMRNRFTKSRIVISCRTFDYQNESERQIADLPQLELQRFDKDAQRAFVTRWYDELVRTGRRGMAEGQRKRDDLLAALAEREEIADLAGTPLLLALIALVHTEEGELPPARALLYQRCVRLLLVRWRPPEGGEQALDEGRLLTLAAELGYRAHAEEQRQGTAFRGLTRTAIREVAEGFYGRAAGQGEQAQRRAEQQGLAAAHRLLDSNGLLLAIGGGFYAFAHRTFQEFLAGQYLGVGSRRRQALEHAGDDHWRVALHLMAGYGAREGNSIDYLLGVIGQVQRRDADSLFLAAEMLAEIGQEPLRDKGYDHVFEAGGEWHNVAEKLRAIAFDPTRHPDPRPRNRAATLLDRIHADNRPALDWCTEEYWVATIPPGPFVLGDDNGRYDDEKPAFVYTIQQPFALARFPVTNRQYLAFLDDLERQGKHKEAEQRRPHTWPGRSFRAGAGNHPVVDVSWYDATAFAAWVDQQVRDAGLLRAGETVRLPTEPEWERAAAYPVVLPHPPAPSPKLGEGEAQSDAGAGEQLSSRAESAGRRQYPWGNLTETTTGSTLADIPANIAETQIGGTSAVGIFPHGAAACGAQDMAGNVWEWCSTPYLSYQKITQIGQIEPETLYTLENKTGEAGAVRTYVLRGGSWLNDRSVARCGARYVNTPDTRYDSYGFRVVRCSPPD